MKRDFDPWDQRPELKVIGIGGGGTNAVDRMIQCGISGVNYIVVNTDVQDLRQSGADTKIQIGPKITKGLGAGGIPDVGEKSAEESEEMIREVLEGTDLLMLTSGMGGGTGTGATPVIARIAKDMGILTIAIVTKPFYFEGTRRMASAEDGIKKLQGNVDTLITIANDKLLQISTKSTSLIDAFMMADDVLRQGVQGISEIITEPGLVSVDFADLRTIIKDQGTAFLGIGFGEGDNRAVDAAKKAINSKLLDANITDSRGILLNMTAGKSFTMNEVNESMKEIKRFFPKDSNIIWGVIIKNDMEEEVKLTLIATGFNKEAAVSYEEHLTESNKETNEVNTPLVDIPSFLKKNMG